VSASRAAAGVEAPFELAPGAHVLFSARASGNLSSRSGVGREQAGEARERLRERLQLRALAHARQVHGVTVRRVTGERASAPSIGDAEADGHTSDLVGVGLIAFTADCLPVALACEGAVAMLHAGWRGLAAGVLEQGVQTMRSPGSEGEIVAVIGPGAGVCCYEVGEEVHDIFGGAHREGRKLDLKALARARLHEAGVGEVLDLEICTICDERFFSHRREGALAGRQVGVAWRR
jgi:purine-nucleoside/S-methyl-5'-thioadenosine phosphorylase / adenosine deaminase